ncbi:transcription factor CP2 isoform X2 [Macaca nemestrina]|uniref:transcription factor CP2 isoform X2 n=1 Tax=Macaca nemestrina TaxID=9545 RepID=UPI001E2545A5|nr:transcription factor CP2-like [Macaca fascicularis]
MDCKKMEKHSLHERDKYQTTCESTVFLECSPWPEFPARPWPPLSFLALTSPDSCSLLSPERLCSSPPFALDTLGCSPVEVSLPLPTPHCPKAFSAASSHTPEWGALPPGGQMWYGHRLQLT